MIGKKLKYCKGCGTVLNITNAAVVIKVFRKEIKIPTGYCKTCARKTRDSMQDIWDRKVSVKEGLKKGVGEAMFGRVEPKLKKTLSNSKKIDKIIKKAKKKGLNTEDIEKGIGIFKELNKEEKVKK